jgi:hypothetical protein
VRVFDPRRQVWTILALALIAGCGSSASLGGGIAGTSAVVAPITGFGSVIVGGIEFDTRGALVTIEGDPATVGDLKLGMVAAVRGVVDTSGARGVAQRIAVEHLAEGPLNAIDTASGTLTLLGQQVITAATTVFDPVPLAQLEPNEYVEIGGFFDASGNIRATRVARQLQKLEIAVKGFVQQLDVKAKTFRLEGLTVDFATAGIIGAPQGLQNGLLVEVSADTPAVDGVLSATDIEVKGASALVDEGDGLKVEGFVTRILSPTDLLVNGNQAVHLTPTTRFVHGNPSDLALDAHIDIDGVAGANGVLIATKVDFSF